MATLLPFGLGVAVSYSLPWRRSKASERRNGSPSSLCLAMAASVRLSVCLYVGVFGRACKLQQVGDRLRRKSFLVAWTQFTPLKQHARTHARRATKKLTRSGSRRVGVSFGPKRTVQSKCMAPGPHLCLPCALPLAAKATCVDVVRVSKPAAKLAADTFADLASHQTKSPQRTAHSIYLSLVPLHLNLIETFKSSADRLFRAAPNLPDFFKKKTSSKLVSKKLRKRVKRP